MAPRRRSTHPGEERPSLPEIVVKGDESLPGPSRPRTSSLASALVKAASQAASKKGINKSSKPAGPQEQQQDSEEPDPEVQEVDDPVDVSDKKGKGKAKATVAHKTLHPRSRSAPPKRRYCPSCTERKLEPGEDGRTRQNAKYRCTECRRLNEQAASQPEQPTQPKHPTQPTQPSQPSQPNQAKQVQAIKRNILLGRSLPSHHNGKPQKYACPLPQPDPEAEQDDESGQSTESDDPENPPIPNARNNQVDVFGRWTEYFNAEQAHAVHSEALPGNVDPAQLTETSAQGAGEPNRNPEGSEVDQENPAVPNSPSPLEEDLYGCSSEDSNDEQDYGVLPDAPPGTVDPIQLTRASTQRAGEPNRDPEGSEVSFASLNFAAGMASLRLESEDPTASQPAGASSSPDESVMVAPGSSNLFLDPRAEVDSSLGTPPPAANEAPASHSSDQDRSGADPLQISPGRWEDSMSSNIMDCDVL